MEVERALMRVNEGLESFGPDSLIHSKPSGLVQKQPRKLLMTEPSKKRKLGMKIRAGKGLVQPGSKTQFLSKTQATQQRCEVAGWERPFPTKQAQCQQDF